jgi:hypothetical protein
MAKKEIKASIGIFFQMSKFIFYFLFFLIIMININLYMFAFYVVHFKLIHNF